MMTGSKTKVMAALAASWLLGASALPGQALFKGGVGLFSGSGSDQVSKMYVMKGPYAIRWTLMDVKPTRSEDSLAEYWTPHTDKNPPWIAFKVMDGATREIVSHDMVTAWENQMLVKEGGKHYLVVSASKHVAWTIYGKEGKLEAGGDGSKLVPVTAADTGGGTAEAAAAAMIEKLKETLTGAALDEKIAAVRLVASRSNSAKDFTSRIAAYRAVQGW